jgi:hypothetical protein
VIEEKIKEEEAMEMIKTQSTLYANPRTTIKYSRKSIFNQVDENGRP